MRHGRPLHFVGGEDSSWLSMAGAPLQPPATSQASPASQHPAGRRSSDGLVVLEVRVFHLFLCFDSHGPRDAGGPRPTGRYIDSSTGHAIKRFNSFSRACDLYFVCLFGASLAGVVASIKRGHLAASGSVRGQGGSLPRWGMDSLAPPSPHVEKSESMARHFLRQGPPTSSREIWPAGASGTVSRPEIGYLGPLHR